MFGIYPTVYTLHKNKICTVLYYPALWCMHLYTKPRIWCMHQTESKVHFFWLQKNRPVSYISACHCRDPRFCYQCETIFTVKRPILTLKHAFFRGFQRLQAKLTFHGVSQISACSTIRNRSGALIYEADFSP